MLRNPKTWTTIGAVLGILGGIFVSYQMVIGFYIWLVGNSSWIIAGILLKDYGMIAQFGFFHLISVNGIYQWGK